MGLNSDVGHRFWSEGTVKKYKDASSGAALMMGQRIVKVHVKTEFCGDTTFPPTLAS